MNQQEQQWAGDFGDEYLARNQVKWEDRVPFWQRMLDITNCASFLEVGCNAGWNMQAIRKVNSDVAITGIDVNETALLKAAGEGFDVEKISATEIIETFGHDCARMVFTAGVLIHVPPDAIDDVMAQIAIAATDFVLAVEYASDKEEAIEYRGNVDMLWRRPYGEMYQALGFNLIESGELGESDGFGKDCTYFLLEKQS